MYLTVAYKKELWRIEVKFVLWIIPQERKATTPKGLKKIKVGFPLEKFFKRGDKPNVAKGMLFIRNIAVENALYQYLSGILAWASRVKPVSTMCLCFLSATPFCWWVWGHEYRTCIPYLVRWDVKAIYSPPMSVCRLFILLPNCNSTFFWNWMKTVSASDLSFKGKIQVNLVWASMKEM